MKINFLLPPYKGESFYSFICRHRKHTESNYLHISKVLFNGYSHPVNQRLPFDLVNFTKKIEHISVLTADEIISNHSLYPLYSSLMSPERSQELYSFMKSNRGHTNHFVKIDTDHSEFHYCRLCAEEEYTTRNESFWHTDHSIPFIQVCTKHKCQLSIWKVPSEIYNVRHYYDCDFKKLRNESPGSFEISDVVLNSAERLVAIQNKLVDVDLHKFFDVARQKDFFQIKKSRYSLNQSLLSKYITFLDNNGAEFVNAIRSRPVVVNALFGGRMHPYNPHNFSYLTEFLESISIQKTESPDFKPVVCCNKFCENFNKTIDYKHVTPTLVQKKTQPGAKAICPSCGIEFLMSIMPNSCHKLVIKKYGWLIRKIIRTKLKKGSSFRQLETELEIERKRLAKINANTEYPFKIDPKEFYRLRTERRQLWKNELISPYFISIAQSKIILKTEYRWLQKKDSSWMRKINCNFRNRKVGRSKSVLDDRKKFLAKLLEIKQQIIQNRVPRKISVTLIKSHLTKRERTLLEMHDSIKHYCKALAESHAEFITRRNTLLRAA